MTLFSADAVKAFYNLNRYLALRKLKDEALQVFMEKYNNSSNTLGINDFVQNVADLLYDPNSSEPRKGVVAGYIDDLYWAASFTKMVEVVKFVIDRGPVFGYNLNMKKCIYLMTPIHSGLLDEEMRLRINILMC